MLIWDIGTLVPGASGDATFKVKIDASVAGGTVIRNTAILTTNETEPVKPSVITKIREPAPLPVIMPVVIVVYLEDGDKTVFLFSILFSRGKIKSE